MEVNVSSRIVSAEKMSSGILVEFADGKCAIYSDSLLYSTLPKAKHVRNTEPSANNPSRTRRGKLRIAPL